MAEPDAGVTDQIGGTDGHSNGSYSFINANATGKNVLSQEMAHQFMGDTQTFLARQNNILLDTLRDAWDSPANDIERAWMRNVDQSSGPLSHYPLSSAFHDNAATFQKSIQPTKKPQ